MRTTVTTTQGGIVSGHRCTHSGPRWPKPAAVPVLGTDTEVVRCSNCWAVLSWRRRPNVSPAAPEQRLHA